MRKLVSLLVLTACSAIAFAQSPAGPAARTDAQTAQQKGNVRISGTVTDSTTQKPVEFAMVALTDVATNKPIDGAVCDDKGKFTINKVAPGNYKVVISFIGFESRSIRVNVADKKDDIDLGKVTISPTVEVLKEVTVTGQKALVEERVDRTIYNAENDVTTRGGDATDVLKRVPMLSVDLDGNVSLRGNQNIQVLINNKPSTIVASSIADALKQIPADQIKAVEVITSPSAKYDAEGSAGIINIVTKKNTLEGLTLGVDMGAGLRGSNLGLNGNYRKGKMGFSLGGWGRANYNVTGSFRNDQRTSDPEESSTATQNIQQADTRSNGLFGNYNLGWDYDINEKNYMTASVRFGVRNNNSYQDDLLTRTFNNDVLTASSLRDAITNDKSNSIDANLTYTHQYEKPQQELSFQALYSRNNRNNDFENVIKDETDFSTTQRFKNLNDSYNQEATFQVDYQTPISTNQMLELGAKDIMRKAYSDYTYLQADGANGTFIPSTSTNLNNNLNYDQNVMAGYLSYTYTTKTAYSFKAGARYEYTTIDAYTLTESDINIPSYGVLVPSVNISKKLTNGNTLKASYNRRIQRPSIRFLNPNIQASNPLNVTIGNPELTPEYTNNYEVAYSTLIKGTSLNFSGFVRNTTDAIQSVRDVSGDTIRTTYQNIGNENAYGASVFANVTIGKLSLNGGADGFYTTLKNNNPDPLYNASNTGWVISGRMFGSYNLSKGWGFQFFGFYRGRQVQLQGYQGGFGIYSLGLKKDFNDKKGSIGFGAENFFTPSIKVRNETNSPILSQNSVNTMHNLSVKVTFSYRIGKMSMDAKPKRRKSINNDDLKEGGDGGGMDNGGGQGGTQQNGTQGARSGQGQQGQRPTQGQTPTGTQPTGQGQQFRKEQATDKNAKETKPEAPKPDSTQTKPDSTQAKPDSTTTKP